MDVGAGCLPKVAADKDKNAYVLCPGKLEKYSIGSSLSPVGSIPVDGLSGMTTTAVLAIDSKNKIHIAYPASGNIVYVTNR
jgi:hypothetical protein